MKRLASILSALLLVSGCGDAVVGGECADGYEYCDGACRPSSVCHPSDGAGDVTVDAPSDSATDAGEADSTADSSASDSTLSDSTLSDSSAVDSPDSPGAETTTGDTGVVGSDTSVVDTGPADTCPAPPYNTTSNCGACGVACSGTTPLCKTKLDGTFACGPVCDAPTTLCPAGCVDLDVDPSNCGSCGKVCPTGLCNGGKCRGAKAGHVVVIGHDFVGTTPAMAVSRVIVNAVFLPAKNPVRLLAYEQWADPVAIANVKAILDDGALASGRTYVKTSAMTLAEFRDRLLVDDFDAALVFDQPKAPAGALDTIGADTKLSLDSFSRIGGVVVVLDGASGVSEMPRFLTASTMLGTSGHTVVTGKPVDVVAPADAVGVSVLSPYSAPTRSVSFTVTEAPSASLVTVVSEPVSTRPVVLHKVVFK